jgi:hypothetical protein
MPKRPNGTAGKKPPAGPPAAERSIPMVAATAIIWAVGLIIAAYAEQLVLLDRAVVGAGP